MILMKNNKSGKQYLLVYEPLLLCCSTKWMSYDCKESFVTVRFSLALAQIWSSYHLATHLAVMLHASIKWGKNEKKIREMETLVCGVSVIEIVIKEVAETL